MDLEKVSGEYAIIYQLEDPSLLGSPISTHISPFQIENEVPSEVEVKASVRFMKRNKAGGHTHLRSKHLQWWIREGYPIKYSIPPDLA